MKDFHLACFNSYPDNPYQGQLGNGWDITGGDWTPCAEHIGREKNAADTKVFILWHSDLLRTNVKKEWIPLLLFKLAVWIVPTVVVDAGFSLWCCVSRFLWTFFPCPAISHSSSSFCSHWLMEQVLVTAVKLWSYCMVTSWQFWWSWLVSHTEY